MQSIIRGSGWRLATIVVAISTAPSLAAQAPPEEKKYAFEAHGKSWDETFELLSDTAQMPMIGGRGHKLTGTFSYISPRVEGKPRQYALGEILDLLNESLQQQKRMIVRRNDALLLISTDDGIPFATLPRLTPADLSKRGRTEPVAVVLPLRTLKSERIAEDVKCLLGPTGQVLPLPRVNSLLLCDNVGSVERAIQIIANLERTALPGVAEKKIPGGKEALPELADKKIAFDMRLVRWSRVFEWLSDETGLPIIGVSPPFGSFTFIAPTKGKEHSLFTVTEVIDLINEELLARKHLLVRRATVLQLVTADEKIEPSLVPLIESSELGKRGRTELVSLTMSLRSVGGLDGVRDLEQIKGAFGEVIVLESADCVVLQDTVANLRRVLAVLAIRKQAVADQAKSGAAKKSETFVGDQLLLDYVRLTEISKTEKDYSALLRDLATNRDVKLRVSPAGVDLQFGTENLLIKMRITVLRIEGRSVYFRCGKTVFEMRVGDNMKEALARPLDADKAKKLQLLTGP